MSLIRVLEAQWRRFSAETSKYVTLTLTVLPDANDRINAVYGITHFSNLEQQHKATMCVKGRR